MNDAIVVEGVHKRYGQKRALHGLDLTVRAGTVHGVLGPNGAGKTTAVRILSTLLRHDGGRAEVAGFDVRSEAAEVRRRIGLLGQHAAVDEELGGRQNLEMFGRLYHLGARRAAHGPTNCWRGSGSPTPGARRSSSTAGACGGASTWPRP